MLSFANDYTAGAHPEVLRRLVETNLEPLPGYGSDRYCASAAEKIAAACECPQAEVYFLAGGTQTNMTVISAMLQDWQGVVAAQTGHVSAHEAGAIEHSGHKVLCLGHREGKLDARELEQYLRSFYQDQNHEHMVFPGMVYLSHPTEYGTLYTKKELEDISFVCRTWKLPLFLDGARLGYALASPQSDVTLPDIARFCDVFYIGGTKVGALCGEAIVFTRQNTPPHFVTQIKQRGALMAKGRLLGVQFDALFTDDLYLKIGKHALEMTEQMKTVLKKKGYSFYLETPTNQQFLLLENWQMEKLREKVEFSFWEKADEEHTVVRFAASWSTTSEDIRRLEEVL